ncbi:efflux RND transporter permease subunit [candidate division KSB1 bacterium]|nr:efflux RND transporter permease subunit [candidate division KSB1 bacterium]
MKLVKFSIARPVTITMIFLASVIFGWVAFDRLPINLLPDISYPTLTVRTGYPGTAPGEVENLVSKPIEESVGVVSGVVRTSSISRPGVSDVIIEFEWNTNMDFASLDIREKLDMLALPRDAEVPVVLRFDPSLDPIMRIALYGEENLIALRLVAEERIKQELESLDGVAAVQVSGGLEEEIQVELDAAKLASLGIPITQVTTRLGQENVNLTGGTLKEGEAEFIVRTLNEFQTVDEINDIVVGLRNNVPVVLRDVAKVHKSHKERNLITRVNNLESVEIAIYKEADQNTVMVARRVKEKLDAIRAEWEKFGVKDKLVIIADQSEFIQQSVDEVLNTAIYGGILAVLVLWLFLRNLKSTVIISLSIPISVIVTFFLMYVSGVTLNIMSLGGLALGVGMLVDNSIVVLEAIDRYRKQGLSPAAASDKGASEVGVAVTASTLTTVCVFLPIIFVEGIAGQLFNDQALTVTFSLMASLLVALTLIPMLSSIAIRLDETTSATSDATVPASGFGKWRQKIGAGLVNVAATLLSGVRWLLAKIGQGINFIFAPVYRAFESGFGKLQSRYPKLIDAVMPWRGRLLAATLFLFLLSLGGVSFVGTELVPEMSQGEFYIDTKLPVGSPVEATDRALQAVAAVVSQLPETETVYTIAGASEQAGFSSSEERENLGQVHVKLKPGNIGEREQSVMDRLRVELNHLPGMEFKFSRPTLFSFKTPIEVEVRGYNLTELERVSLELAQQMREIPGLKDVKASTEGGNPEVQIVFNRRRVAALGLDINGIGSVVRNKVQGEVATEFTRQDRKIDIRVRASEEQRRNVNDLRRLIVNPASDVPVPLASIAEVRLERGPSEIRRIDQERVALVTANLSGRDLGSVTADIQKQIDQLQLPPDFLVRIGGQQREMATSFDSMKLAIGLAVFLVYLVMASQFESLVHPFVIMFTIPFGLIGVIITLLVTRTVISVVVLIGVIMLAGIVVNNAIVLIDYINQLRKEGVSKLEAIKQAGQIRMRPIFMTTLTTILGLLPMALGFGEGAELRTPLAVTVIGGLTIGTLLTLVVIPMVYAVVERRK